MSTKSKKPAGKKTVKSSQKKVKSAPKKVVKKAKPAAKKTSAKAAVKKTPAKKTASKKTVVNKVSSGKTVKKTQKPEKAKTSKKNAVIKPKAKAQKAKASEKIAKKAKTEFSKKQTSLPETKKQSKTMKTELKTKVVSPMKQKTIETETTDIKVKPGTNFLGIEAYSIKSEEEYMNDSQRQHFKEILLRWKRALMEEVDRTMMDLKDEPINHPDLADRASQEEEFNLKLRARDRERKLIAKIDEALDRLKTDEFGYCRGCGIEIGIRRLEARPTATLCIDCKTLDEIKEKQTQL